MFYILRIGEDNPLKVDPEEFKLMLKKYCFLKKYNRRLKISLRKKEYVTKLFLKLK